MFTEAWLAHRYLKAGKKEKIISLTAFISMAGIAIGVFTLIVVIGVMSGFDRFLQDKMVGANAHLSLDFFGGTRQSAQAVDELMAMPHVVAAAPFIGGQAFFKEYSQVTATELRGIDPALQPKVSKIAEYMTKGTFTISGNELVLGEELAMRAGVGVGDSLTLISPSTLAKTEFKVAGLFKSGMYLYDSGLMLTSIKGAQDFFKVPDLVTGISVKVDDIYKVDAIKQYIYRNLKATESFSVRTWVDLNRNFLQALKIEKVVMFIVVTMTTVVAAFGIVGTLIMSVMSRIKDIGILRSLGAKTKSIVQIFVFQGLSIGVSGIILGLVGGVFFTMRINSMVDAISRMIGHSLIPKDIYYFDRIPVYINAGDVSAIVFSALAISLMASVYPALYAARINPSEALRHE
jgi:lipoprotein-releasing system permease protein